MILEKIGKSFNVIGTANNNTVELKAAPTDTNEEYFITDIILDAEGASVVLLEDGDNTAYTTELNMTANQHVPIHFNIPVHTAPGKNIALKATGAAAPVNAQVVGYSNP